MKKDNQVIEVELNNETCFIFYQESFLLTQLKYYPLVQLSVIAAFLLISYVLFSTARKAEQNRVWVGMSKETAHQLGTPISSLMAWVSLLEAQYPDDTSIDELKKDVDRLETIADRFSKIGSAPVLVPTNMKEFLDEHVGYLRKRVSKKVSFEINQQNEGLEIDSSRALMGWVLENLIRNAVDAMEGEGKLTLSVIEDGAKVYLDVEDTGKGIPKSRFKSIFQPGFTTKKRGWGLGLALVKRIVEEYHNGNISVVSSDPNTSTVFRIVLKKS